MNAEPDGADLAAPVADAKGKRKFLVVVDDTPECRLAVRFAGRRAAATGGSLVLLRVIEERAEMSHWLAVEERMREEAFAEAENLLQEIASEVHGWSGLFPAVTIRHGQLREEVLHQIDEDSGIRVLVLAAAPGPEGPGPLVSSLASTLAASMHIPVTVVPGNLTNDQVDDLA